MTLRIRLLASGFLIVVCVLVARLFFWQIVRGEDLSIKAKLQHTRNSEVTGERGSILASDGTWLSANSDAWLLYVSKTELKEPYRVVSNELASLLVSENSGKTEILDEAMKIEGLLDNEDVVWVPIEHKVSSDLKNNIEALNIEGIGFEPEQARVYPEASSAAHLLGFVGKDTFGQDKGYFGLEGYYDLSLTGRTGYLERESDAVGSPIIVGDTKQVDALHGVDLVTSIDKRIQLSVEDNLKKGLEKYGANQGTVVVINPNTGAILAMAALPSYDPVNYSQYGDSYFKNPVISDSYEPGSIFKPIIMASGLDAGVVRPDTVCDICDKPYKVDKYYIKTWNNEYHEGSRMVDVIVRSDNVGMVFVANKLGSERMYDYLEKFGFGNNTGIDLQGEFSPVIREKGLWNVVDLATASFGQGIAVTPIQMIKAIAIIANHGYEVTPQVVDRFKLDDWEQDIKPENTKRIISEKAASEITAMMVEAVKSGEAKWSVPKGFKVAGKTGTAQIPVAGHYDAEKTYASFVGFAPPDNPKFAMIVTLREPQSSPWASETAAPLWFDIAKDIFLYLGIQPGS